MASTRKSTTSKGTARWQAVWRERGPFDTVRQRTKNFATLKEAREHAERMGREVEGRGVGDPGRQSLEQYLNRWLATQIDRGELRASSIALYRRNVELACRTIGAIPLAKLSAADLDSLYATLQKPGAGARGKTRSAVTVLAVHRLLSAALRQARRWKLVSENVAQDATAPSPRRSAVRAFTRAEVDRLLSAAASDRATYTIAVTLLITGMRRGELLGLAWDCIDLDRGTLAVRRTVVEVRHTAILQEATKTESSTRTIQIPPLLVDLLRMQKSNVLEGALRWGGTYRREPMFVFPQVNGEPLDPLGLTYRLRTVMRRAAGRYTKPCEAKYGSVTNVLEALRRSGIVREASPPCNDWFHGIGCVVAG